MTARQAQPVLVIGGSGLVGRRLVQTLLAQGRRVRCLARDPARVADLAASGCEVERGDIIDPTAVRRAMTGASAVLVAIHTLSPQPGSGKQARFMDIEGRGIDNVIAAARAADCRRVVYVTSLGIAPDAPGEWLRERWRIEQRLLDSGLDATVIRPGHIVGIGGQGFDAVLAQAPRRIAVTMVGDWPLFRTIALDDLVDDIMGVLDEPRAYGRRLDVGSDDVLSVNGMIDIVADVLGRPPPAKLRVPRMLLRALGPVAGRMAGMPRGAFTGFVEAMAVDSTGDPGPIRSILPRARLGFRDSVKRALDARNSPRAVGPPPVRTS